MNLVLAGLLPSDLASNGVKSRECRERMTRPVSTTFGGTMIWQRDIWGDGSLMAEKKLVSRVSDLAACCTGKEKEHVEPSYWLHGKEKK